MIDHDRLFKELLTTFIVEFLKLFLPKVAASLDPDSLESINQEVFTDVTAGEKHAVDILMKGRVNGEDTHFLIQIENQSSKQTNFSKRMYVYFSRLYEKYDLPVVAVAVFSYDKPLKREPSRHTLKFLGKKILDYHYEVVQLNRLDWQKFLGTPNPIASALMSKMKIEPEDRPIVKAQCVAMMFGLQLDEARSKLIEGFVETYIPLDENQDQVFRTELDKLLPPAAKEKAMEVLTTWEKYGLERGMRKGLQEGRQEGRQEGEVSLLLRQLGYKVGELTPEIKARIQSLPESGLDVLSKALFNFSTVDDLNNWIAQQQ